MSDTDRQGVSDLARLPAWGLGGGHVSAAALLSLTRVRSEVLRGLRRFFEDRNFVEVTTATLTQMSGSCENPATMFSLRHYGSTAYLSQSAQLQLEIIVGVLQRPAFTITTSYRAEDYEADPGSGRRLSEFTLVEVEGPGWNMETMMQVQEDLLMAVIRRVLSHAGSDIEALGGDVNLLESYRPPFPRVAHAAAAEALVQAGFPPPEAGVEEWDFGMREERTLIHEFGGGPLFLVNHPEKIKYFNVKCDKNSAMSVDLLCAPIGEVCGGGERESDYQRVLGQLRSSRMLRRIMERGGNETEFSWYLDLLQDPGLPPRAGFGLGLERLVGFLLNTDDVLRCLEFPRTDKILFP